MTRDAHDRVAGHADSPEPTDLEPTDLESIGPEPIDPEPIDPEPIARTEALGTVAQTSTRWTMSRRRIDEWMDDPNLDPARHAAALAGLRRLNRISLVASQMMRFLENQLDDRRDAPVQLLDIASGSGDLPLHWARHWRMRRPLRVTLSDRSELPLQEACRVAKSFGCELQTIHSDWGNLPTDRVYDVATCSLFLHHLEPAEVVSLVTKLTGIARRVVLCDLVRSRFNLSSVAIASRLVSRSDVVHHDATASIRGAYRPAEWRHLFRQVTSEQIEIRRLHPARMIAVLPGNP